MLAATAVDEPASLAEIPREPVLLYDGTCGFCAKAVRFVLRHERDREIRFAPLQGPTASALRAQHPRIPTALSTVVYVADGRAHLRSKAILNAAKHLRAPYSWLHAIRWFPAPVLDLGYRAVARARHRLGGTVDACELPAPEERARFLP